MCQRDDVQRDADVNPLLLARQKRVVCAVSQRYRAVAIAEVAAEHHDTLATHGRQLVRPEVVPERVSRGVRDASVEPDLLNVPRLECAQCVGEGKDIIVRVGVSKSLTRGVEQVLAVHKHHGAFVRGLIHHREAAKE